MINSKTAIAITVLAELAKNDSLTIKDMSNKAGVSVSYTEQTIKSLRDDAFIRSRRGPGGGYVLNVPPEQINLGKVIEMYGDKNKTGSDAVDQVNQKVLFEIQHLRLSDVLSGQATPIETVEPEGQEQEAVTA